jgi:hypothetical protein
MTKPSSHVSWVIRASELMRHLSLIGSFYPLQTAKNQKAAIAIAREILVKMRDGDVLYHR